MFTSLPLLYSLVCNNNDIHYVWYNLLIAKFISLLDIRFNTFLLIQIINTLIFPCMIDTSLLLLSPLKHYFYIHWNYFTNSIFTITTLLSISLYIHHFTLLYCYTHYFTNNTNTTYFSSVFPDVGGPQCNDVCWLHLSINRLLSHCSLRLELHCWKRPQSGN